MVQFILGAKYLFQVKKMEKIGASIFRCNFQLGASSLFLGTAQTRSMKNSLNENTHHYFKLNIFLSLRILRGYPSFFLTFLNGRDRSYFLVSTFKGWRSKDFFFKKSQMACCSKLFFIMPHGDTAKFFILRVFFTESLNPYLEF